MIHIFINKMEFAHNIEVWRMIDNYNNYEISSHGRVRNNKTERILISSIINIVDCQKKEYIKRLTYMF